jgi:hypothetical protein
MACYPGIELILNLPDARAVIEQPKLGKANQGIKSGAYCLSSLIAAPIRRDRPDGPLTLSHGQVHRLEERQALETAGSGDSVASPALVAVRPWQCKSDSFRQTESPASRGFSSVLPIIICDESQSHRGNGSGFGTPEDQTQHKRSVRRDQLHHTGF